MEQARDNDTLPDDCHAPILTLTEHIESGDDFLNAYPLTPYPVLQSPEDWSGCAPYTLLRGEDDWSSSSTRANLGSRTSDRSGLEYPPLSSGVSSAELKKILQSILDQVDWLEVALTVAKDRPPAIYLKAVEEIFEEKFFWLKEAENEGSCPLFEGGKHIDMTSGEESVEQGSGEDEDEDEGGSDNDDDDENEGRRFHYHEDDYGNELYEENSDEEMTESEERSDDDE